MNIGRNDLVLEIGSGHNPNPRADVLCDKFLLDDTERGGAIVSDRPLVIADAEALPFPDKAFDYVICSHALEHARDAVRFLSEVERVGRAGYIETPSSIAERLYGWDYHRWLVDRAGDGLTLRRKTFDNAFGLLFHEAVATDADFARFHRRHHPLLLTQYEWRDAIQYAVLDDDAEVYDLSDGDIATSLIRTTNRRSLAGKLRDVLSARAPESARLRMKAMFARLGQRTRRRADLRDLLVCPSCRQRLVWDDNGARCETEGLDFKTEGDVPVMLLLNGSELATAPRTDDVS